MRLAHGRTQRPQLIVTGRRREMPAHEPHRRFLQHPGRLSGSRILHDDAVLRIRRASVHAGQGQRSGVDPCRVPVVGRHVRGTVRHEGVENLAGRQPAREWLVVPAPAGDPGLVGIRGGVRLDRILDVGEGDGVEQIHAFEPEPSTQEMGVGVVEAGHHRAAVRIDDRGLCPTETLDLAIGFQREGSGCRERQSPRRTCRCRRRYRPCR